MNVMKTMPTDRVEIAFSLRLQPKYGGHLASEEESVMRSYSEPVSFNDSPPFGAESQQIIGWVSLPNGVRDIKEWTSNSKVHIEFYSSGLAYQDFPMKRNKTIKITCQEFRPLPGDGTERKWNDGQSVVRIPSYAIAKNHYSPTRKALETYFNENRDSFLEELDINQDELVKLTLKEARRQANRVSHQIKRSRQPFTNSRNSQRCYITLSTSVFSLSFVQRL